MLNIPNSHLSQEATIKVETLEKIFNGSILVYSINNKKKERAKEKFSKANMLWNQQTNEIDKDSLKKPKEESAVTLAQIVMVADDAPDYLKELVGRSVWINSYVGKTFWLSKDEIEELTWIDETAIYGFIFED